MYKITRDIITEKDIGKSKYQEILEPFEDELDNLCVEFGKKKYDLCMKQMKIITTMKEKIKTSFMDDEYIKKIQDDVLNLELYLKAKNAL